MLFLRLIQSAAWLALYLLLQPAFVLSEHHKFNVLWDVAFLLNRSLKMELNYK